MQTVTGPQARRERFVSLLRGVCATWLGLALSATVHAQVAPPAASPHDRVDLSVGLSLAPIDVAVVSCCGGLRTAPEFPLSGTRASSRSLATDLRLLWIGRYHSTLGFAWNRTPRQTFSFTQPAAVPPSAPALAASAITGRATERSGWTVSAGEAAELVTQGRWRPWVGGRFVLERVSEVYEQTAIAYTEPTRATSFTTERQQWLRAGAVAGGLRVFLSPRVYLATELELRAYVGTPEVPTQRARWMLGGGTVFGPHP